MTVVEILQKAHRKFAKDTDYPEAGSEDLLVRVDHLDDGVSEWENCVFEGVYWEELMVSDYSLSFGGTGTDARPANFLSLYRPDDEDGNPLPAQLKSNSTVWEEVTAKEGARLAQEGLTPYVFWIEGSNVRTLPAASGSIPFPYLKKATRYTTGEETTEPEMRDHKFLEDFVTAKIYLDNGDDTLYQASMLQAKERLDAMKYSVLT